MATRRYFLCQIAQLPTPFRSATSANILRELLLIISSIAPNVKIIRCDNATVFTCPDFKRYLQTLGIQIQYISRSNSRANSLVERFNRSLNEQLRMLDISPTCLNFDLGIQICTTVINAQPNLLFGISPYEIIFARQPFHENQHLLPSFQEPGPAKFRHLIDRLKNMQYLRTLFFNPPRVKMIDIKVGDKVRIQQQQPLGTNKIQYNKFSAVLYDVLDVNNQRGTLRIRKEGTEQCPLIIHHRHCKVAIRQGEPHVYDSFEMPEIQQSLNEVQGPMTRSRTQAMKN